MRSELEIKEEIKKVEEAFHIALNTRIEPTQNLYMYMQQLSALGSLGGLYFALGEPMPVYPCQRKGEKDV